MLLHFYIAQFLNTFLYVFCLGVMPRKFWPFHSHKVVLFLALNSVSMLRHFDIREGRTVFQMATQLSQYNFLNKSFPLIQVPHYYITSSNILWIFLFYFIDLSYSSTILLIIINLHYILIQSYSPIQTFLQCSHQSPDEP